MLAALQQLGDGREVVARLQQLDVAEDEVAVHQLVERGLLPRVLAVAKPLLLAADIPRHFLVLERLARLSLNKRNLHLRRKMIRLDGLVGFLKVFHDSRLYQIAALRAHELSDYRASGAIVNC